MKLLKPLLLFVFALANLSAFAQNSAPVISNITSLADTLLHKLTVTFNVADAENDNIEIFLSVSADSGVSYPYNTTNATGNIGFPVTQGNGKQIEWYYPDSLSHLLPRLYVKLTAGDHAGFDIQQIVNQIDTNRLKQNLQFIEGIRHRVAGSIHLQQTRDSLTEIFKRHGLQTRTHSFLYGINYFGRNIVGRKPGADDNGSAIAAMLEILRVISPLNLQNTVEFIGFDLEEAGLAGSKKYVVNGIKPYEDIQGVMNMDMISYYSEQPNSQTVPAGFDILFPALYARLVADSFRANFIISTANAGSTSLLGLFDSMATQYVPNLFVGSIQLPGNGEIAPDSRKSDHAAFWDSGYVALHISDGAETRNPNYHGPTDVSSTVNYNFMSHVTKAVTATLLNLAGPLHADVQIAHVTVDPASGIWEMEHNDCSVFLSPNPTSGHLKVQIENCGNEALKFRVYSMEGKLVWQSALPPNNEIYLNNLLEPGYYILEMSNSRNSQSKKILIR